MSNEKQLSAIIEYDGKKAEFKGSFEDVWRSVNLFFEEVAPKNDLLNLVINLDLSTLIDQTRCLFAIDKDVGPVLLPSVNISELNREEKITLVLLMRKISYMIGTAKSDSIEMNEIEKESMLKSPGPDVSELITKKIVKNLSEAGKKGLYRITDYGTQRFLSSAVEKIIKK